VANARSGFSGRITASEGDTDMKTAFVAVLLGCSALVTVGASAAEPTPNAATGAPAAGTAGTSEITVQQPAPQIRVQQAQPTVTVRQPRPEIIVRQPPPVITVQIPQPEIIVRMPKPEVTVSTAPPQVSVNETKPQVQVQASRPQVSVTAPQQTANVQMQEGRPAVHYEQTGQPQINVANQGQPKVVFEEVNATGNQQATGAAGAAGSQADAGFAAEAYQGGIAEVQMGQLAQQKAGSDAVKQFGQMLVHDHMQADSELQRIAQQQHLDLPAKPDANAAEEGQKLQNLSGSEFDQQFVQQQVAMHRTDINEFRQEAQSGSDPALKAFAAKTLPVLEQHLQMAESLSEQKQGLR
jgi:putative membrane protein